MMIVSYCVSTGRNWIVLLMHNEYWNDCWLYVSETWRWMFLQVISDQ
jgi:hypothetical protein